LNCGTQTDIHIPATSQFLTQASPAIFLEKLGKRLAWAPEVGLTAKRKGKTAIDKRHYTAVSKIKLIYIRVRGASEVQNQEPITRSLHPNCTLESTLSRIFLFLEL